MLAALVAQPRALMDLVDAGGVAVVEDGEPVTCGGAPPPPLIREIARWLEERGASRPFSSASLGVHFPPALAASEVASGLLTFALPGARPDVVPAGGHPDGELGRRSNQARRCGGRQAPAPAPLVRSVEGGGARPLPSVDAERSRGRRRVAAPRHGSGHRAASFQRAARRARAR